MNINEDRELNIDDWEQAIVPDFNELANLVNAAKGDDRTMGQFAEECGTSSSTLSRVVNKKNTRPMALELLKSIAEHAALQSNVSFEQLLRANGWRKKIRKDSPMDRDLSRKHEMMNREGAVRNLLSNELLVRGANVKVVSRSMMSADRVTMKTGYSVYWDIVFETNVFNGYDTWAIEINPQVIVQDEEGKRTPMSNPRWLSRRIMEKYAIIFLCDQWEPELLEKRKITFVFVDPQIYRIIKNNLIEAETNNYFTLMLVDLEENRIIEETPLMNKYGDGCSNLMDIPKVIDDDMYAEDDEEWHRFSNRFYNDGNE
ncbi:MAG: hypothetical protein SO101_07495 [Lachnospiraceae bacterium]|nr:hypothetical protein [Lachnospiraceae bacterium]